MNAIYLSLETDEIQSVEVLEQFEGGCVTLRLGAGEHVTMTLDIAREIAAVISAYDQSVQHDAEDPGEIDPFEISKAITDPGHW